MCVEMQSLKGFLFHPSFVKELIYFDIYAYICKYFSLVIFFTMSQCCCVSICVFHRSVLLPYMSSKRFSVKPQINLAVEVSTLKRFPFHWYPVFLNFLSFKHRIYSHSRILKGLTNMLLLLHTETLGVTC